MLCASPGTVAIAMPPALEQRRLVGERLVFGRGHGVEQQLAACTLGRLGAHEAVALDRLTQHRAAVALERVDHRQDRHRGTMLRRSRRDGIGECRRGQRPRPVVDQHDIVGRGLDAGAD